MILTCVILHIIQPHPAQPGPPLCIPTPSPEVADDSPNDSAKHAYSHDSEYETSRRVNACGFTCWCHDWGSFPRLWSNGVETNIELWYYDSVLHDEEVYLYVEWLADLT